MQIMQPDIMPYGAFMQAVHQHGQSVENCAQIFAPGRVNIIGEHTDYNGGKVLPFAIQRGITANLLKLCPSFLPAGKRSIALICVTDQSDRVAALSVDMLDRMAGLQTRDVRDVQLEPTWLKYVLGAWTEWRACLQRSGYDVSLDSLGQLARLMAEKGPFALVLQSDLPVGGGLSSSAALSLAVLRGFEHLTRMLVPKWMSQTLTSFQWAKMAQRIESEAIGVKCGLMDQMCILKARRNHALKMDFSTQALEKQNEACAQHIPMHTDLNKYTVVVVGSGAKHCLADSPYNKRRLACEQGVKLLNTYFATSHTELCAFAEGVDWQRLSTALNGVDAFELTANAFRTEDMATDAEQQKRGALRLGLLLGLAESASHGHHEDQPGLNQAEIIMHVLTDHQRVESMSRALISGDLGAIDRLLTASHTSYAEGFAASCPEIDALVAMIHAWSAEFGFRPAGKAPLLLGPRMTGGGFGGNILQYVHESVLERFQELLSAPDHPFRKRFGHKLEFFTSSPHEGLVERTWKEAIV